MTGKPRGYRGRSQAPAGTISRNHLLTPCPLALVPCHGIYLITREWGRLPHSKGLVLLSEMAHHSLKSLARPMVAWSRSSQTACLHTGDAGKWYSGGSAPSFRPAPADVDSGERVDSTERGRCMAAHSCLMAPVAGVCESGFSRQTEPIGGVYNLSSNLKVGCRQNSLFFRGG